MPKIQQILHKNEKMISIIPNISIKNGNKKIKIRRTVADSITINNNIIHIQIKLKIPQLVKNNKGQTIIIFLRNNRNN